VDSKSPYPVWVIGCVWDLAVSLSATGSMCFGADAHVIFFRSERMGLRDYTTCQNVRNDV
jgi:hypothetical protein